jgi:ferrous iron transport protein A
VLLGVAPLGDPLEVEFRGYRLSVRKSEAAKVEIEL